MRNLSAVALATLVAFVLLAPGSGSAAIVTLQPGAADLKDTWIWDAEDFDHGSQNELRTNDVDSFDQRILIEFSDLSAIPAGATINSALLYLYRFDGASSGTFIEIGAFAITSPWLESVTYSTAPTFNPSADDVVTVANANGWYNWNIQTMVQQWVDGSLANNGVLLYNSGLSDTFFQRFASSDVAGTGDGPAHPGAEFTPILEIDFTAATVVPEPSTLVMSSILFGMFGVVWSRKWLKQRAAAA